MQDRLLNAYLAGTVDEIVYKAKSNELKSDAAQADEALAQLGDVDPARAETALALFDWTQNAAEIWRGSNNAVRREILDAVCLNRTLTDLNLDATKRKPFDVFAKGLEIKNSRGDWIRTSDLCVPKLGYRNAAKHEKSHKSHYTKLNRARKGTHFHSLTRALPKVTLIWGPLMVVNRAPAGSMITGGLMLQV